MSTPGAGVSFKCHLVGVMLSVVTLALAGAIYTAGPASAACPNESLRVGFSAALPDCRAYEVVTPDTGPNRPTSLIGTENGPAFSTALASPNGESVIFNTNGAIQGLDANGRSDQYESVRGPGGWVTDVTGPSGAQAAPIVGGSSPDHGYTFWEALQGGGTLSSADSPVEYLREPNGNYTPIGLGSLGQDLLARGLWIGNNAEHVIFAPPRREGITKQLEPEAPPSPIEAIYDRSPGGPTHVVSLLPGDVTPTADANYLGVSEDGSAVFFEVSGIVYERKDDATTTILAPPIAGGSLSCRSINGGTQIQWLRNGAPIAGADGSVYTLSVADEGTAIQCQVTKVGATTAVSSPALVAPLVAPAAPQQLGKVPAPTPAEPAVGNIEACPEGSWLGSPSFAYQWYSNGVAIVGATSASYEVQAGDVPGTLQCAVTATNAGGSVLAISANTATQVAPSEVAPELLVDVEAEDIFQKANAVFAGSSRNGSVAYYLRGRAGGYSAASEALFEYRPEAGTTTTVADEGEIWIVNVSADGSRAYFLSTANLTGSQTNSEGQKASEGELNLYLWNGSTVAYVATLAASDLVGFSPKNALVGLATWSRGLGSGVNAFIGPTMDPSRTSGDGSVFVFQSHANLIPGYDSAGHSEVFRYDEDEDELICVSCNPSGATATAEADLVRTTSSDQDTPLSGVTRVPNLTEDGKAVIFETTESLLGNDENDVLDVYEWRDGQLSLISSGQSVASNYIFGASADGRDIFFRTNDTLVPQDQDGGGPSIYDARIGGGFAPQASGEACEQEGCQGALATRPALLSALTPGFQGSGDVHEARRSQKKHKKRHRHKRHDKHRKIHKSRGGNR